jgi:hypothetical protein
VVLRHHDFGRFGLNDDEHALYLAALDMGMEGLITERRFIYRDTSTGESWSVPHRSIVSIAVIGREIPLTEEKPWWEWNVRIWTQEQLDPAENPSERLLFGDLTLTAADQLQAFEVGARLAAAIHDSRSGTGGY